MKVCRTLLLILLCAAALVAQQQMNVEQLVEMIRSSIALQHEDRRIADYVKKVKLTERLTDKTIQDLMAQGAGPRTVDALKKLRDETESLKPPAKDVTSSPATGNDDSGTSTPTTSLRTKSAIPTPDSVKQAEILDEIRQYASTYTHNLPNFICTKVIVRYVDFNATSSSTDGNWHKIDSITSKLGYENGAEKDIPVLFNNQPIVGNFDREHVKGGSISSGEFGDLMAKIFEPQSEAHINWNRWGNLGGRLMAVYDYFIDSGHSAYSIDYNGEQRIITAYKGLVYADPYTGVIYRVKLEAVDIPSSFPVKSASEVLDYDETDISGNKYICPLRAVLYLRAGREKTRNDIEFRLYRKFGTESFIKYDVDTSATPLPDKSDQPLTSPPPDSEVPLPPNSAPPPPPNPPSPGTVSPPSE